MPSVVIACTEPRSRPVASTTNFIAMFCRLVLNDNTHTQSDAVDKIGHDVRFKGPSYSDAGTASFTSTCANNRRQEGTSLKRQEPRRAQESFWRLVQLSTEPASAAVRIEDFDHDNHVAFLDLPLVACDCGGAYADGRDAVAGTR
jgi:hypothetical protein